MSVTTYTTVNGRILRQIKDGVVHNFVSDPLGSVVMVRDTAGNTVYTAEYDPYGNVQSETGTNPSEFGYVGTLGYVKDSASSLYVRARYLLTNLGRWLTKDPLWPSEPGFVYAGGRPCYAADPSGLIPFGLILPRPCSVKICRNLGFGPRPMPSTHHFVCVEGPNGKCTGGLHSAGNPADLSTPGVILDQQFSCENVAGSPGVEAIHCEDISDRIPAESRCEVAAAFCECLDHFTANPPRFEYLNVCYMFPYWVADCAAERASTTRAKLAIMQMITFRLRGFV